MLKCFIQGKNTIMHTPKFSAKMTSLKSAKMRRVVKNQLAKENR